MPLVSKAFGDIITFTRASTATYFDSTGTLQSAAIDAPRLDYNPSTLAAQGLLIEEARTNSIRNNTGVGAVNGVIGSGGAVPTNWTSQINTTTGLTREVVGTGTENGIAYVDFRLSGTATGAGSFDMFFEQAATVAALTGQTWAGSVFTKLVGGTTNGLSLPRFYLYELTSASGFIVAQVLSPGFSLPTAAALNTQRYTGAATLSGGATTAFIRPLINYTIANGAAIDITLRIGLPQLELGAFATSVIPTTTTALTRSADVASVNTLSPWYNQTEGTVYAELQSLSPLTGAQSVALNKYPHVWQIEAGASDSTLWWYGITSELYISTTFNNIGTVPSGINKFAVSLAPTAGQSRSSLNGAAAVNRNGTLTGTATLFSLGKDSTNGINNFLNGYLRRLTYYPRALSAAELQAITA